MSDQGQGPADPAINHAPCHPLNRILVPTRTRAPTSKPRFDWNPVVPIGSGIKESVLAEIHGAVVEV